SEHSILGTWFIPNAGTGRKIHSSCLFLFSGYLCHISVIYLSAISLSYALSISSFSVPLPQDLFLDIAVRCLFPFFCKHAEQLLQQPARFRVHQSVRFSVLVILQRITVLIFFAFVY